jgi:AcrR family transcriptional regulator
MAYHHGNLKEALLVRAAEVIAEDGVEALSLRGLARDLAVSHAAPRRHFADRRALLTELAKEAFRRSVAIMDEGAAVAGSDPVARYRALGRSYVEFARRDPAFYRAMNHPEVRSIQNDELATLREAWFAALREGAAAAQRSGWHPEADPEALVAFSVSAAIGAAALFSDGDWQNHLACNDVDVLADDVLDLVVGRTRTSLVDAPNDSSGDSNDTDQIANDGKRRAS